MEALAEALAGRDPEASAFYRQLVLAEARHRCVYLDLAAALAGVDAVIARFDRLAAVEAAIVGEACAEPRLHSGHGGPGDAAAAGP
jgi:tRNA isopentenyl-2-thiomethyl-A-37 hydroxylase MiaE